MTLSRHLTLYTIVLTVSLILHASAQTRHALVIGNDTYPGNELHNARNDAKSIYQALRSVGYASTLVLDANRATLSDKVDAFVDTLKPGDTALLYYAGHGFQLDGENYLVPVDFKVVSPEVAREQGYALSSILERFTSHGATTQIIILDACRDNPFLGTRSMKGGWAGFGTSAGSFLAFGTSPGSTASDDPSDGHGLFTKDLLKYLTSSNQDIEEMFRKVREDVIRDSDGKQVPWIASSLIGSYHIRPEMDLDHPLLSYSPDTHLDHTADFARSLTSHIRHLNQQNALSINPSESAELSRALTLARSSNFDAAIGILQNVLRLHPAYTGALTLLGLLYHADGRDVTAIDTFDTLLQLDPSNREAATYRCAIEGIVHSATVIQDCEAAVRSNPSAENYMTLAAALQASGDSVHASADVTQSIALEPSDLAFSLRGMIEEHGGMQEAAKHDFARAVELSATTPTN